MDIVMTEQWLDTELDWTLHNRGVLRPENYLLCCSDSSPFPALLGKKYSLFYFKLKKCC